MSWVMNHDPAVRLGCFVGVFLVMAVWELAAPRRRPRAAKGSRWFTNLGHMVLGTLVVRVVFPTAAVGMALVAGDLVVDADQARGGGGSGSTRDRRHHL